MNGGQEGMLILVGGLALCMLGIFTIPPALILTLSLGLPEKYTGFFVLLFSILLISFLVRKMNKEEKEYKDMREKKNAELNKKAIFNLASDFKDSRKNIEQTTEREKMRILWNQLALERRDDEDFDYSSYSSYNEDDDYEYC